MRNLVDYTKMRRNSMIHNAYIAVCPKCHRKGLRLVAPASAGKQKTVYMHKGERLPNGVEMTDGCEVWVEVTAL